jgi:hypothetical protein
MSERKFYAVHAGWNGKPILGTATVKKETAQRYQIEADEPCAFHWVRRLDKANEGRSYFATQREAWMAFGKTHEAQAAFHQRIAGIAETALAQLE